MLDSRSDDYFKVMEEKFDEEVTDDLLFLSTHVNGISGNRVSEICIYIHGPSKFEDFTTTRANPDIWQLLQTQT